MKKKLLSILLSLALVITMMPAQTLVVSAATKTKATVSTQAGLKKALKNKGLKTLTVETGKAKTFTINKGTYKKVHMIIDAPKSTVKNKSTFKKITIKQNKTLQMDTAKGSIVVPKGGKANEVKLTKKNSKIDINVNGELKKISVEKKSEINLKGTTKKPVVVNAGVNSDETVIKTNVKVNANIGSNSKVVLQDGSEGSSIVVTNKDILVTVVNNTDAAYTATDANGKDVEIKKDETVVIGGETPVPTPTPTPTPDPTPIPTPTPTTYTVTFNMQGHGAQIVPIRNVSYGSRITEPKAPTAEGYTFEGWYKEKECKHAWRFNTDTVKSNTTLYAKWTANKYNVTPQVQGSHGTATVKVGDSEPTSETTQAVKGTSLVFTATPNDGYEFDHWEVVSGGIDIESVKNNAEITVTMPANALTMKAHFKVVVPDTYNIIVEDDGHGTASANPTSAAQGTNVALTATPNDGYAFKEWQIARGLEEGDITNNSFTMPSKEVKVKAIFERVYDINLQTNEHGTVTATVGGSDATTAAANAEVTLTATPNNGYQFKEWKVVSGVISINDNKFTMPESNVTVMGVFEKQAPAAPTFKAVYNTKDSANTLTFYYDAVDHSGDNITVYEGSSGDNYLFDSSKSTTKMWGYNGDSTNIKSVAIDSSVANYNGLTSTAYMFTGMSKADSISGAEYLDVSNVTDMSYMFSMYGSTSSSLATVPNVSNWNTAHVTNMSYMFRKYGSKSETFTAVPDVSKWNTGSVTNLSYMFNSYGSSSKELNAVPAVNGSNWNTAKVENISYMFESYGNSSEKLNDAPDMSQWTTNNVTNTKQMFKNYGSSSTVLNAVPNVSGWNTGNVTDMSYMFDGYGKKSGTLDKVPNVSGWNTDNVTNMNSMFNAYGSSSTALNTVPAVNGWKTENVTDLALMFKDYGSTSTTMNFNLNLSGWNVQSVYSYSSMFENSGKNTTTWSVTIPAKTGEQANDTTHWYVGDGTDTTKYIAPASDREFTVAGATTEYTVTFDMNGIDIPPYNPQTITSGGKVAEPDQPADDNHTFAGWYKTKDTTTGKLSDKWDFNTDTVTEDITLYAQWTRTLESIIATNPDFPNNQSSEYWIPDNPWVKKGETGFVAFFDEYYCELIATTADNEDGSDGPRMNLNENNLLTKVNDNYVYAFEDGAKVICYMKGETFTSFEFEDTSDEWGILSGTYAPATPAPEINNIADVLATVDNFPSTSEAGWRRGANDAKRVCCDGGELRFYESEGDSAFHPDANTSADVTAVTGGYKYSGDKLTITFLVEAGKLTSFTVESSDDAISKFNGTFKAPAVETKTIAEILPVNFPEEDSAWVTASGEKCYIEIYDGLTFSNNDGDSKYYDTEYLAGKYGNNYIYSFPSDPETITFNMTGGVLTSITLDGCGVLNGTYKPAAPAPEIETATVIIHVTYKGENVSGDKIRFTGNNMEVYAETNEEGLAVFDNIPTGHSYYAASDGARMYAGGVLCDVDTRSAEQQFELEVESMGGY